MTRTSPRATGLKGGGCSARGGSVKRPWRTQVGQAPRVREGGQCGWQWRAEVCLMPSPRRPVSPPQRTTAVARSSSLGPRCAPVPSRCPRARAAPVQPSALRPQAPQGRRSRSRSSKGSRGRTRPRGRIRCDSVGPHFAQGVKLEYNENESIYISITWIATQEISLMRCRRCTAGRAPWRRH